MALGLLMPLTPLADTRLVGYITVGSGSGAYGFVGGQWGSVSGEASADMSEFYWAPGMGGIVVFTTAAFDGGYFYFMGRSVLLTNYGGGSEGSFSPAQISGWPTSGTHPFYLELP